MTKRFNIEVSAVVDLRGNHLTHLHCYGDDVEIEFDLLPRTAQRLIAMLSNPQEQIQKLWLDMPQEANEDNEYE